MRGFGVTALLFLSAGGCVGRVERRPERPALAAGAEPDVDPSASSSAAAPETRVDEQRAAGAAEGIEMQPDAGPSAARPVANPNDAGLAKPSARAVRDCEDVATQLMWTFAQQHMPGTVAALEAGPQFPLPDRRVTYQSEAGRIVATGDLAAHDPHLVFWLGVGGLEGELQGLGWVRIDPASGAVDLACAGRITGCDAYPGKDPWYRPPFEHRLQTMVRTACEVLGE